MQSPLRSVIITVLALIIAVVLLPWIMRGIGYYVDNPGWEVGEIAAERKDPQLCQKIIVFSHIFGPTGAARRGECIYRYASLTQDPTACELLMPSEYGLACISNLWPEVSGHVACGWNHADSSLFECRDNDGLLHQGKSCEDFKNNQKQFSACISYMAERAKQAHQCAQIPDQSIRSFCETKMGAWEKYPELRGSFYFGQATPQQL
ncbi:MAG: hypothetical protein WC840_03090 [Candidatus Peribacteraceae bacterium]